MAFNQSIVIPDISLWQDNDETPRMVDFHQMRAAGAVGVIIRAGQNSWLDPDFVYNWKAAKDAGLPRGTYWFYDSRNAPVNQARLFLEVVGGDLPELGYWLDLEENYGGSYRGWANWKACLTYLRDARPGKVGVYTSPGYWAANKPSSGTDLAFFGSYPLWIAHYGVVLPTIPAPWTLDKTLFWQYTSKGDGRLYGAESANIDLNLFNGDEEKFKQLFGGNIVLPPKDGGSMPVIAQYKVVWGNGVARRTKPTTSDSYTGKVYPFGEVVDVVEENIPDATDPTNPHKTWVRFADGLYGACDYPDNSGVPQKRMARLTPPTASRVVKGVFYNEDGTSFTMYPEGV